MPWHVPTVNKTVINVGPRHGMAGKQHLMVNISLVSANN